jgi:hypothetical protein
LVLEGGEGEELKENSSRRGEEQIAVVVLPNKEVEVKGAKIFLRLHMMKVHR